MLDFLSSSTTWTTLGGVITAFSAITGLRAIFRKSQNMSITIAHDGSKTVIRSTNYSKKEMAALVEAIGKTTSSTSGSVISQAGRTVRIGGDVSQSRSTTSSEISGGNS